MQFSEVKKEVKKFVEDRNWDQFHTPDNLAKSISIEAGELLECFQWSSDYDTQAVKEELADVMIYCVQLADKLGISIEDAMVEKLRMNAEEYWISFELNEEGATRYYVEYPAYILLSALDEAKQIDNYS